MIRDCHGQPRYADKQISLDIKPISIETKKVLEEISLGKFIISKEFNYYPRGYPRVSPGWP